MGDDRMSFPPRRRYERLAGYSTGTVVELTGLTYRQLDWWVRVGRIAPSYAEAAGSGSVRDWSEGDVAKLRLGKLAVDSGASLDTVSLLFAVVDRERDIWWDDDRFLVLPVEGTAGFVDAAALPETLRNLRGVVRVLHCKGLGDSLPSVDR